MEEDRSTECKTWQVYYCGEGNVWRFNMDSHIFNIFSHLVSLFGVPFNTHCPETMFWQ